MYFSRMEGRHVGVGDQIRGPYELLQLPALRGLTMLPAISKLFRNLLLRLVSPHVELKDHQYGFRHERGTADAQFALDATVRPRAQRGELTYLFFLDWSKAPNRVMHHALLARLAYKGVTGKLWRLIDSLYQCCSARTCIDGG
jgi:hypothetical protein